MKTLEGRPRPGRGRYSTCRPETGGRGRKQHHAAFDPRRQGRRHHRRMGANPSRGVRRIPRPHRRRRRYPPHVPPRRYRSPSASRSSASRAKLRRRLKLLVGKPGLDGHSNGARTDRHARARDCGFEVLYEGIRLTPNQIVNAAPGRKASTLSACRSCPAATWPWSRTCNGRHGRPAGISDIPLIVGGIIPPEDEARLLGHGRGAAVYTPKDFDLTAIMADMVKVAERAAESAEAAKPSAQQRSARSQGPRLKPRVRRLSAGA